MSNFNYKANVQFTTTAGGELDLYQVMTQTPTTEVSPTQTSNVDWWDLWEQACLTDGPVLDNPVDPSSENSMYLARVDSSEYFPEGQVHPLPALPAGWDYSFASATLLDVAGTVPAPRSSLEFWDHCEGELAPGTFCPQNVYAHYEPDTGASGTAPGQARRFQPYKTNFARLTKRVNAEAGPSTLPCTTQASGWEPETTADAEKSTPTGEEAKAQMPKRTKAPQGQGTDIYRINRARLHDDVATLSEMVEEKRGLYMAHADALAVAVEVIPTIRMVKSANPWLRSKRTRDVRRISDHARGERERRSDERVFYEELSRYYPRPKARFTRQEVLSQVIRDLRDFNYLW